MSIQLKKKAILKFQESKKSLEKLNLALSKLNTPDIKEWLWESSIKGIRYKVSYISDTGVILPNINRFTAGEIMNSHIGDLRMMVNYFNTIAMKTSVIDVLNDVLDDGLAEKYSPADLRDIITSIILYKKIEECLSDIETSKSYLSSIIESDKTDDIDIEELIKD